MKTYPHIDFAEMAGSFRIHFPGKERGLETEAANFGNQVWEAVEREGKTYTEEFGMIYAYETDGFGMYRLMDDANVPSLLSMDYLGYPSEQEAAENTRRFLFSDDEQGIVNPAVPDQNENWGQIKTGDRWEGRDRYLWMQQKLCIPKEWKGRRALGIFDFGKTGAGNNSGFEAMCYINGKPYQGVDVNHKEVFFPEELYGSDF